MTVSPELKRLQALIAPVGIPGSVQITICKLYLAPRAQNKHVLGHHVGSWSFVPKAAGR